MTFEEMTQRIATGQGFIAALDQSGGSTPKALRGYGVEDSEWSGDEEMFAQIHTMRSRIIEAPSFGNGKVIGAILFEKTMDGQSGGKPVPTRLQERGVVPFLKVDKGLEDERDGAQLMKPNAGLEDLCHRARDLGVFGTKMRSVIKANQPVGIKGVVHQQFADGAQCARQATGAMGRQQQAVDLSCVQVWWRRFDGEDIRWRAKAGLMSPVSRP